MSEDPVLASGENGEDQERDEEKSKKKSSRYSRSPSRKSKKKKKSSSKRSRSRSRSRSPPRDRDRRKKRSRSRSKDRRKKEKKRSRSPPRDKEPREKEPREKEPREPPKDPAPPRDPKDHETVFVSQIHPKVDERDLFDFFSHVGRVEDIRLIRDQRTHKSKGLAYVEFSEKDSVNKAIALTGQLLGGYPITIQITPHILRLLSEETKAMRLYVGSLHFNVTDSDLLPVFEAFGPVDSIDIHKDHVTGKSKGFGFVTYRNEADAKQALANLDGLEIAGRAIKVGVVSDAPSSVDAGDTGPLGELDEGGGLALTAQSRVQLMQKLQRGSDMNFGSVSIGGSGQKSSATPAAPAASARVQPTGCIVIKNMFNPAEEKDSNFDLDLKEDVEEEAGKYGKVKHVFVDKESAGHVYIKFHEAESSQKCVDALNGRWFASRKITADYVPQYTYNLKFPNA